MKTLHNKLLLAIALSFIAFVVLAFRSKEAVRGTRTFSTASSSAKLSRLPGTILWAWERPEKLDFIDPTRVGVAFLAKTVYLRGENVASRPRLQALHVPDGTKLIAVARLESDRHDQPRFTTSQLEATAAEVADSWLSDLPIDEAVPMLFRLGAEKRRFTSRLRSGEKLRAYACQDSAGVSTDEPVKLASVQRLYVFNPTSWSPVSFEAALGDYHR